MHSVVFWGLTVFSPKSFAVQNLLMNGLLKILSYKLAESVLELLTWSFSQIGGDEILTQDRQDLVLSLKTT